MSRGLRNNNPGNIRISSTTYLGEIVPSQDKAFKQFESMPYGYRAMFMLLYTYHKRYGLNTIRKMIYRYAPPIENHTDSYVNTVVTLSGVGADKVVNAKDVNVMIPIVAAMSRVENGVNANMEDVKKGWELFIR